VWFSGVKDDVKDINALMILPLLFVCDFTPVYLLCIGPLKHHISANIFLYI
jgi:hypothetical protein